MKDAPLVSILIPNYNYGRFLGSCLDSAINQTYENLQVVFVDNHSTDDSYEIAMELRSRHKDRLLVYRNDENIGGSRNHARAYERMDPRTKCYIYLSSDDLIHPSLVERSMNIMREFPSVGFVIVHRNALDENGQEMVEPPFYNCNCVVPGTKQMEVFMMAGIGVCSQCFRHRHLEGLSGITGYTFDISGDWFSNFCLACVSDMGYIRDPLCSYRVHKTNVTSKAVKDLTNSLEHILMIHAFSEIATQLGRPSVSQRLQPALEKLGSMCLRYATQLLREGDAYSARRYLHLAPVLKPDIGEELAWRTLWKISGLPPAERLVRLNSFEDSIPQKRMVSYDPPEGSIWL